MDNVTIARSKIKDIVSETFGNLKGRKIIVGVLDLPPDEFSIITILKEQKRNKNLIVIFLNRYLRYIKLDEEAVHRLLIHELSHININHASGTMYMKKHTVLDRFFEIDYSYTQEDHSRMRKIRRGDSGFHNHPSWMISLRESLIKSGCKEV